MTALITLYGRIYHVQTKTLEDCAQKFTTFSIGVRRRERDANAFDFYKCSTFLKHAPKLLKMCETVLVQGVCVQKTIQKDGQDKSYLSVRVNEITPVTWLEDSGSGKLKDGNLEDKPDGDVPF